MAQLNIFQIKAWDATRENAISFDYNGDQVFKNQAVIRNNSTNAVVYDQTQTTFQLKHTIAANSLVNGICYNIQMRTYDKNNVSSPWSKIYVFYCFATPTFAFSNIVANQIIQNSSIEAQLTYTQLQSEPLNTVQFILYNEHKSEITRSGMLYNIASLKYTYSNLENDQQYFVQAIGETLNNMIVDTGSIPISVHYITPAIYAMVELTNLYREGQTRIRSNMISILGHSDPTPPLYVNNVEVDLSKASSWVKFDEGFEIDGDFTLQINVRDMILDKLPLILSNGQNKIEITYMQGTFASQGVNKGYFQLKAFNGVTAYVQMSNYLALPIAKTDNIFLWIRCKNHVFEIIATTGGV